MPRKPLDNEWAAWYPFRKAGSACRCLLLSTPPEAHCQVDRGINRRRNFVKFNDTDDQLEKIIFAVVFWSCAFSCRKILEKFCLYLLTFVSRSSAMSFQLFAAISAHVLSAISDHVRYAITIEYPMCAGIISSIAALTSSRYGGTPS